MYTLITLRVKHFLALREAERKKNVILCHYQQLLLG